MCFMLMLASMRMDQAKLLWIFSSRRKMSVLSLLLAMTWMASARSSTPCFFQMSSMYSFIAWNSLSAILLVLLLHLAFTVRYSV